MQELIEQTGENIWLTDLHRLHAVLAKKRGDGEAVEHHLYTALDIARHQGAKLFELRAAIDLAHLWQEQGRTDEAIGLLQPVHDSIAEGDCPEDRATAAEILPELAG